MFKQLVCLVVGTLAVGSQAFMAPSPLVKASSSAAARVYQPIQAETGTCAYTCRACSEDSWRERRRRTEREEGRGVGWLMWLGGLSGCDRR